MAGSLTSQVALVTGGGRGIGQGIARAFAAEGGAVAVMSRTAAQLAETVAQCTALGVQALAGTGDVTSRTDVERLVAQTEHELGPITVLVNNAGITGPFAPIHAADPDEWWRTQEVHVHGMFLCTRTVLPGMMVRGAGRIITIASRAAETGNPNFSGYSTAKVAQVRFTELLSAECAAHGITAFVLHPGLVDTQFADEPLLREDAQKWMPQFVERLKTLKEQPDSGNPITQVMDLCVGLASGQADTLSGRYFSVDDDLAETVAHADEIQSGELYTLRIGKLPGRYQCSRSVEGQLRLSLAGDAGVPHASRLGHVVGSGPVHQSPIVPNDRIANGPLVVERSRAGTRVLVERVEQCFGLLG